MTPFNIEYVPLSRPGRTHFACVLVVCVLFASGCSSSGNSDSSETQLSPETITVSSEGDGDTADSFVPVPETDSGVESNDDALSNELSAGEPVSVVEPVSVSENTDVNESDSENVSENVSENDSENDSENEEVAVNVEEPAGVEEPVNLDSPASEIISEELNPVSLLDLDLPPDCIGDRDLDGVLYCVNPESRLLSATLEDGQIWWSFVLPGDNASNEIEAVHVVNGNLVLVADTRPGPMPLITTTEHFLPKYEISVFTLAGGFIATQQLNQTGRVCNGEAPCLQRTEGLAYGNISANVDDAMVLAATDGSSLLLAWQMFERELASQDSPWLPAYGAVVNVDINTGNVLVERRYPDQSIVEFQIADDGTLFVETELRSDFLGIRSLQTQDEESNNGTINGLPSMSVIPALVQWADRGRVRELWNQVDLLSQWQMLNNDSGSPVPWEFEGFEDAVGDDVVESAEQFVCDNGGSSLRVVESREQISMFGSGNFFNSRSVLRFENCAITVDNASVSGLEPTGTWTLNGDYRSLTQSSNTIRAGSISSEEYDSNSFSLRDPDGNTFELSGSENYSNNSPARTAARAQNFRSVLDRWNEQRVDGFQEQADNFSISAEGSADVAFSSRRLSIDGMVSAQQLGTGPLTIVSEPGFDITTFFNSSIPLPERIDISGTLSVADSNGASILVQSIPVQGGGELNEVRVSVDTARSFINSLVQVFLPFEALLVPISIAR